MSKDFTKEIYEQLRERLSYLETHPDEVTDEIKADLSKTYSALCRALGLSDHSAWGVKWTIEKRNNADEVPFETIVYELSEEENMAFAGNIILNSGANEMLKLVFGLGGTAFNKVNSKMVVGDNSTAEDASQSGIVAISNRAEVSLDSGYPSVSPGSRTAVLRATFGDEVANFAWKEISLTNGSISLNRKQKNMGEKVGGVWTVQLEISIVEM